MKPATRWGTALVAAALISVTGIVVGATAGADETRPPNLCTTQIIEDTVMEWRNDTVGIEWRAYAADGHVIGYGAAPDPYTGLVRAGRVVHRNAVCAQYQPPDLEVPW